MIERVKNFTDLVGHTIVSMNDCADELTFKLANGQVCRLYHEQDCCESVSIEDVSGDFKTLIGTPLLAVEETSSSENPPDYKGETKYQDSFTWTTYTFTTERGAVTIRWYGESNGYYSEDVYFVARDS
jgi:hypothetical protein